jgi:ferric-dicitrate binding protein FerR (iron transport regulator)
MSDSPVGPDDIRAAAETYRELGPDYQSAVVASFLHRVDQEVEARVQARLAAQGQAPAHVPVPAPRPRRRGRRARDIVAAAAGAAVILVGVAAVHHSGHAVERSASPGGGGLVHVIPGPNGQHVRINVPQPPAAP